MTRVIVKQFNRGLTSQKYPAGSGYAADMTHCDISTDETLIKNPKRFDKDPSSGTSSTYQTLVIDAVMRSDGLISGVGKNSSASSTPYFWTKYAGDMTYSWVKASFACSGTITYWNSIFLYNDKSYIISRNGSSTHYIDRYDGDANIVNVASFTESTSSGVGNTYIPKAVVHPLDKKVYIAVMKTVFVWDGSSSSLTTGITTPDIIINIEHYGSYLAISCVDGNGKSVVYFWGRDTTLTTFQDMVQVSDDRIIATRNMNGRLIAITTTAQQTNTLTYKVSARQITSAGSTLLAEANVADSARFDQALSNFVARQKLYFIDNGTSDIWTFGFSRDGAPYLSKERQGVYDGETNSIVYSMWAVSDYLFVNCDPTGASSTEKPRVNRTYSAVPLYSTLDSIYTFSPNESIQDGDIGKIKRLNQAYLKVTANSTSYGTVKLEVRYDEGSWATVFQESADATRKTFVVEATADVNGDAFNEGRDIQFRVTFDQGLDISELGYDYETVSTTI